MNCDPYDLYGNPDGGESEDVVEAEPNGVEDSQVEHAEDEVVQPDVRSPHQQFIGTIAKPFLSFTHAYVNSQLSPVASKFPSKQLKQGWVGHQLFIMQGFVA